VSYVANTTDSATGRPILWSRTANRSAPWRRSSSAKWHVRRRNGTVVGNLSDKPLEAAEAAARQRWLVGAVDQFPRNQATHGRGKRDRRVHDRQVEAGHLGDWADDWIAFGRHWACADPGAE